MNPTRDLQSSPAAAHEGRKADGPGWFGSTWDLIRGLDVRELSAAEFFGRELQALPSAT